MPVIYTLWEELCTRHRAVNLNFDLHKLPITSTSVIYHNGFSRQVVDSINGKVFPFWSSPPPPLKPRAVQPHAYKQV